MADLLQIVRGFKLKSFNEKQIYNVLVILQTDIIMLSDFSTRSRIANHYCSIILTVNVESIWANTRFHSEKKKRSHR
jgi:hypothetical protein